MAGVFEYLYLGRRHILCCVFMFVVHVGGELNGGVRRIICSAVKGARLLHACCHVTHFFRTAERILGVVGQGYQPTV
jgi:hypothetical protein